MVEICRFWYDSYTVSEGLVVVTEFLQPANSGIFFTAVLQHFHSTMSSPPFTAFPAFKDIDIAPMANPSFPLLVVLLHPALSFNDVISPFHRISSIQGHWHSTDGQPLPTVGGTFASGHHGGESFKAKVPCCYIWWGQPSHRQHQHLMQKIAILAVIIQTFILCQHCFIDRLHYYCTALLLCKDPRTSS